MRYLLKTEVGVDNLLEELSRAAYAVVEDCLPEGRRGDIQMGLYVALSHVLSPTVVPGPMCGSIPGCPEPPEPSATAPESARQH